MGFIGMNGSMQKALSFKRPKVTVNIGQLISYEEIFPDDLSLKISMKQGALKIMEKISDLLPPDEIINPDQPNQKDLIYFSIDKIGNENLIDFSFQEDLSRLIEHPVIMDVFKRNLKLPVNPLMRRDNPMKGDHLEEGLKAIQNYLEFNPGFLSYRFGIDQSIKMKASVESFLQYIELNNLGPQQFVIRFRQDVD